MLQPVAELPPFSRQSPHSERGPRRSDEGFSWSQVGRENPADCSPPLPSASVPSQLISLPVCVPASEPSLPCVPRCLLQADPNCSSPRTFPHPCPASHGPSDSSHPPARRCLFRELLMRAPSALHGPTQPTLLLAPPSLCCTVVICFSILFVKKSFVFSFFCSPGAWYTVVTQ